MAASIDSLIQGAENRITQYSGITDNLVFELRQFISDYEPGNWIPTKVLQNGQLVDFGLDLTNVALPTYTPPVKDTTPTPVYEPPLAPLPAAPSLSDTGTITLPQERTSPVLNISGLFQQVAPSSNLTEFTEAEPDLRIDSLVSEMDAIVSPVLQTITLPTITPFSLGAAPSVSLPSYDAPATPDDIDDPEDYAARFEAAYRQMLPEMQAFIDDKVDIWVNKFAPEYLSWSIRLTDKVNNAMDGEVLPDQFEAAMFTRAKGRVEQEFNSAELGLLDSYTKSGFISPPGALMAGLAFTRLKGAEALANQSTDIYIERRKTEVQHLQFIMNMASSQIQGVRNLAISYAGVVGNTIQQSASYANSLADHLGKVFDHLLAKTQLRIAILDVIGRQYELKLKAALSVLDGYRLELEAEKARSDIELAKIQFVEAQIKAQELEVQRYSAMIEAVTRKSSIEELKLKGYEIRADIFKNNTQAKIAEFDVYKASLDGDKSKLEGELSKIRIFENELNADNLRLEAQTKAIQAIESSNDAKIKVFQANGEVYKLDADAALQKFTAYAEVKKLAQSIYGQELTNAIESFKANLEIPKILMEALIKEYTLRVQTALQEASLDLEKLKIAERASEQAVGAYQAMSSSALGSLNTMASSAISATA
jgi:hypothetical protein